MRHAACFALLLLVDAASQRPDIRALERAVEASPNDAFAHAELASALAEAGDVARAAKSFETAATLRPDDTQLLFNAGYASLQLQRIDAAGSWKAYEKAHRAALQAIFAPKFTHLVPPELVPLILEFSFHLGFY